MFDPTNVDRQVPSPAMVSMGLHPRGMQFPNIVTARRAKRVGRRYLTIVKASGRILGHRDPICTRANQDSANVMTGVFDYGDGQLVAFRDADDPVFVDECPQCADYVQLTDRDSDWKRHAACNVPGLDLSGYFVNPGRDMDMAAELCSECPVRALCADYGAKVSHEMPRANTIIWGGEAVRKGRENVRLETA